MWCSFEQQSARWSQPLDIRLLANEALSITSQYFKAQFKDQPNPSHAAILCGKAPVRS
jgi:hypothetical protein